MRWTMPIVALILAVGLGLAGPGAMHPANGAAIAARALDRALAKPSPACENTVARTKPAPATLVAASLHGWAESPATQAWRSFVAWSKTGSACPAR
jgi:hypothetical protein